MKELLDLFERQVAYVQRQTDARFFLALQRFVGFVQGEPRLVAIIDEFLWEFSAELDRFEHADDAAVLAFKSAWPAYQEWLSAVWNGSAPSNEIAVLREKSGHPSKILGLVSPTRKKPRQGILFDIESSRLDEVMTHVLPMMNGCESRELADDQTKFAFRRTMADIYGCLEYARRRREAVQRGHPGAAWQRLAWAADRICPEDPYELIGARGDNEDEALAATIEGFALSDAALGREPHDQVVNLRSHRDILSNDLDAVREEVVRKGGMSLSHRALVLRFKHKCERFLSTDLRGKCTAKGRKPEDVLTLAAAEYLFEQGLNPLFNAQIVTLRPDLFDGSQPHALYIEAKQYADGRNLATLIRKAAWQVWDTWNELDAQHRVTEAFLLVFRRGGPLIVFEGPARMQGRTLHPVLVDIAPTDVKGSRANLAPIAICSSDLLPSGRQTTPSARLEKGTG